MRRASDDEASPEPIASPASPTTDDKAEAEAEAAPRARSVGHRMLVKNLGARVPPHRLLLEYPLAQQARRGGAGAGWADWRAAL